MIKRERKKERKQADLHTQTLAACKTHKEKYKIARKEKQYSMR